MRVLVLFGAGASRSEHFLPTQPALVRDLFAALSTAFPKTWGALPSALRIQFEEDFESAILSMMESGRHLNLLMQDMTLYFANFGLDVSGRDPYTLLLKGMQ